MYNHGEMKYYCSMIHEPTRAVRFALIVTVPGTYPVVQNHTGQLSVTAQGGRSPIGLGRLEISPVTRFFV